MFIECLLKRPGGTVVELDGKKYHFKPNSHGDHVAEVTDPRHIEILLNIPEGYREYLKSRDATEVVPLAQELPPNPTKKQLIKYILKHDLYNGAPSDLQAMRKAELEAIIAKAASQ